VNTTDTATLGTFVVSVHESGALPVRQDYVVLPSNVYDSLVGSDLLNVNANELGGSTSALARLRQAGLGMVIGTSDNTAFTATTSIMESDVTEATADHFNGRVLIFVSGALSGQATLITDYALSGGRGRFTFSTLTEAVPNATDFVIA
jgi:hypothetical protein